jgi:hypothetical protein
VVGSVIQLGGGATATVLAANGFVAGQGTVSLSGVNQVENGRSLAIRLDYEDFSMWLGGDLTGGGNGTADVETPAATACGDVDVCIINHHGSNTSTNGMFVQLLAPEVAIASAGLNNPFGHPQQAIVNRLNQATAARLMMSTTVGTGAVGIAAGGNITLTTDGIVYTIETQASGQALDFFVDEVQPLDPSTTEGKLVVSEFARNPSNVADEYGEWVELVWTGARPLPMKGTSLVTENGVFTMFTNLAAYPGRPVLLMRDGVRSRNGSLPLGFVWPVGSVFLGDTAGVVQVRYGSGLASIQDTVVVDATTPGGVGIAAERRDLAAPASSSNFQNASTSFGLPPNLGSPRAINAADVTAKPATLVVDSEPAPGGGGELVFRSASIGRGGLPSIVVMSTANTPTPLLGALLPVAFDFLFEISLTLPGSAEFLPAEGYREWRLAVPPGASGAPAWAAHFVFDPFVFEIPTTSNAVPFTFP